MCFKWYFNFILLLFFLSCKNPERRDNDNYADIAPSGSFYKIKYAKHFGIIQQKNKTIICLTENFKDTVFFEIQKPFQRLAVMGTIPVFQLHLLNALNTLVAIDDKRYYNLSAIEQMRDSKKIVEAMPNLQWNYELLLSAKPEVLITYSGTTDNPKLQALLEKYGIKPLVYLDYLEQHPLGRAEWIKVLGCLTGKEQLAEKIFSDNEQNYLKLSAMTDTVSHRPTVLTEVMYSDVWYIAGNQSYIAQMIKDAGGKYVFDFHEYENAQPYSFEYVLKYAKDADFWIHLHRFKSYHELKNTTSKYTLFKAFQTRHCYNNNKRHNSYGYNDYYESGICLPHLILRDLINILHPGYLSERELIYYYQLSE
ncbi:MAG: hypothetical protein KatS3mg028_1113 [Bacteroidia bacterium]|nr:MAG: hypothetical protein KatS3mg028_1113 [Bacteroidia bacterium]